MKGIRLMSTLLLVLGAAPAVQVPAQQPEDGRKKGESLADYELPESIPFIEIRAKAEKGDATAQYNLGFSYEYGQGVEKDDQAALKWYRKAADQNHAIAQFDLGVRYTTGQGVEKNATEAVKWYRKSGEQNWEPAQLNLGVCYATGLGVEENPTEAVKWYRRAAERDYSTAQIALGDCYATGHGVEENPTEAVKWYRSAARYDAGAQTKLGSCYKYGFGVAKDYTQAVEWYRKAAVQGNSQAQINLGLCYSNGEGVTKDYVEAVTWYRKAGKQGDANGQYSVGVCYFRGDGVTRDYAEAVAWYRRAAEQGHATAQYALGLCYANGDGVSKDYVEAHQWFNLASAQGDEAAKKILPSIETLMTKEQIAEAQRQAREFKPRKALESGASGSPQMVADSRPFGRGTGFFVSEDGYLITNEHVIRTAAQVRLVTSSGIMTAKVVKVDAANDLALLKADGRFMVLPVVASRTVRLGNTVATVGFPNIGLQGFAPKLAKGEIAALSGALDDSRYFQISVPVQPGNSGGALVDEHGNVVGIVSAKLNASAALATSGILPENVNYAVKSSFLLGFLESVPEVLAKLQEPSRKERKFEDVVRSAEQAAVLVLVY